MSRVQLALNVPDIDEAIGFYERLFATPVNKRKPGYANFAVEDPPLKLVLIENKNAPGGSLNHLGVEVPAPADVAAAQARLNDDGLPTVEDNGTCCYAEQQKVWVDGADGSRWEVYAVLADVDVMACAPTATCC